METTNVLQQFVEAANSYKNHPTVEANANPLQRHLDVLLGMTRPPVDAKLFDPNQFSVTEFFAAISDFLTEGEQKNILVQQKILALLKNLVQSPCVKDILSSMFHMYSPLIIFLQNYGISERDPLATQCLFVLEYLTEDIKFPYIDSQLESFLEMLLLQLQSKLADHCLGILSNLCRSNLSVRTYVKNMPNSNRVMKNLTSRLSDTDSLLVLQSLSVLTLVRHGTWGEKIFKQPYIFGTFELILHCVLSDDKRMQSVAIKLLTDLMAYTDVRNSILSYSEILPVLQNVIQKLTVKDQPKVSYAALQFLLVFMENASTQTQIHFILLEDRMLLEPLLHSLLHWASQSTDTAGQTPALAIQMLRLLLRDLLPDKLVPIEFIDKLLKIIKTEFQAAFNFSLMHGTRYLQKLKAVVELMSVISENEDLKPKLGEYFTADLCQLMLSTLLESCQQEQREIGGVDVMLILLTLIGNLRKDVPGMDDILQNLNQCSKFVPFLAEGFASTSPARVQLALDVVHLLYRTSNFPYTLLGQSIAQLNSSKEQVVTEEPTHRGATTAPVKRRRSLEANIDSLMRKMEKQLDLKEMKPSEIMDLYEHKISTLEDRGQQLQDLLDAKTTALQKADQLLAEHKCKQALREAEALKLRKLLRESEERSETSKDKTDQAIRMWQQCQQDVKKMSEEKSGLLLQIEELKEAVIEHDHRNCTLQGTIKNVQTECNMLSDNNTLLQKHNDVMKQKQEKLSEDVASLTMETKQLIKQVKDKDLKINELTLALGKTSEDLAKLEASYAALSEEDKHLKDKNSSLIHDKAKLEQEARSLSVLCRQHEASLQEKDLKISSLQDELLKFQDINKMIHELSSKVKPQKKEG